MAFQIKGRGYSYQQMVVVLSRKEQINKFMETDNNNNDNYDDNNNVNNNDYDHNNVNNNDYDPRISPIDTANNDTLPGDDVSLAHFPDFNLEELLNSDIGLNWSTDWKWNKVRRIEC